VPAAPGSIAATMWKRSLGDTPHDVEGAHAAGMACVGVGSDKFTVDQLRKAGADYAIASVVEGLPL
jgi:phosphoglycolate phosphatase